MIDFQLHETMPGYRVTGRNCGADVPVGTVFTVLCRRDFPGTAPGEATISPEAAFVSDISLRLEAVEFYRRSVDHIPSGHTAMLTLSGAGFDTITEVLSTAPERTYYSLCVSHESVLNIRNA
ncbi:MAG TPA: hypothetical protein VNN22_16245 [Verrucomicrobiae bacterium]|nr:hypothetical protein [Verrucomicrobiae bacterium]